MPSEARRGLSRVTTNYARLLATMAIGLVVVPLQLAWVGTEGYGLIALLASSIGIGGMLQDTMRHSMVRELGAAWHTDKAAFARVYATSFWISGAIAVISAVFFIALIAALPLLRIPDHMLGAARWITACEGAATCLIILLSPAITMFVVQERFLAHNMWTVCRRAAYLVATIIPFQVLVIVGMAEGLRTFGTIVLVINVLATLGLVLVLVAGDRSLRPRFRGATRETARSILGTFGWNSSVVLAMNLHERIAQLILNVFFGLWGNAIFGIALRLVSYVRMASLGITFGLDAVSARLSSAEAHGTLRAMFRHSTRLLSSVALPAMVVVVVFAEPLLQLWIGRSTPDIDPTSGQPILGPAVLLVQIMGVGLACRAITDGWLKLLYGAGHIRHYAPLVLAGGLAGPLLSVGLIYTLPDAWAWTAPAISLTVIFLVVHLLWVPLAAGRHVGLGLTSILGPMGRPALVAAVAAPLLLLAPALSDGGPIEWTGLLAGSSAYALGCGAMGWLVLLSSDERRMAMRLVRQFAG